MTITVSTDNARSIKALQILQGADRWLHARVRETGRKAYLIPSASDPRAAYLVDCRDCTCPDRQSRGVECCHMLAVKMFCLRAAGATRRPARRLLAEPKTCTRCSTQFSPTAHPSICAACIGERELADALARDAAPRSTRSTRRARRTSSA